MARLKKNQRPERIIGGHSSIPWITVDSDSFKGASDKAKALLFALMRQHNGMNNGHLHLAKRWLYNQGWTCDESNRKATKELIERGLIIQTKWGGLNAGPNLYALAWYDITNYVGLEISSKGYQRGAYQLCTLPPSPRRKPPVKKQLTRHDDRAITASTSETAKQAACTTTERVNPLLRRFTGSVVEHNVITPLHTVNYSGVVELNTCANAPAFSQLIH